MKKILVLGGTQFIGRNLVERLIELDKYEITLFNRQRTHPELFENCNKIKGNRETDDIFQLINQYWDFIIDVSCYHVNMFNTLLQNLKDKVGRYIFISTISAYRLNEKTFQTVIDENLETLACTEANLADRTMASYGERKAECERILLKHTWLDKIILRPSIVYGKYDHTDRFYYWLYKIHQQKPFILPDNGKDQIILTYINDLVNIIIESLEIKNHSIFYNTSTHYPITLKEFISMMDGQELTIITEPGILLENRIKPWVDFPLWFNTPLFVSNKKLLRDFDISLTPLQQSIDETKSYYDSLQWQVPKAGIDDVKEQEIFDRINN